MNTESESDTGDLLIPKLDASCGGVSAQTGRELFEFGSLVRADQALACIDKYPWYEVGLQWLKEFITQPHAEIGRRGAVCPFVQPALRQGLVYFVTAGTTTPTLDEAAAHGHGLMALYRQLFPTIQAFRTGALVAFFPGIERLHAHTFIDGGQQLMRRAFNREGMALGEFHANSVVGSVHNPDFPVMRSPLPIFAVRSLSTHDIMFLDQADRSATERLECLQHYVTHVGGLLGETAKAKLASRIDALQVQAEQEVQRAD